MKIRSLRKKEVFKTVSIAVKNHTKVYKRQCEREVKAMFEQGPIKPHYVVAEEHKNIVGFGGYTMSWMDNNTYEIFWVNVAPEKQGKGIGKTIVANLIEKIKKQKNAELILLSANAQKNLPAYYAKNFGFKIVQTHGTSDAIMALNLTKQQKKK